MAWSAKQIGLVVLPLLLSMTGLGQRFRFQARGRGSPAAGVSFRKPSFISFAWSIRTCPSIIVSSGSLRVVASGEGWWVVDWPDADDHFSQGVQRLTRIATGDPRAHASHRRPAVRLSVGLCHADRLVESERCGNRAPARVSFARRLSGGGRFLGRRSMGDLPRDHGARTARAYRFRTWPKQIR